jgi:urea ABC transporter urea binding protein
MRQPRSSERTIRIGLLHSLTGTMAAAERSLLDVERMVIDEFNGTGGVLGHRVEAVVADGASRAEIFASRAEGLLRQDVACLFGCWTSASRKAVKPLVEAAGSLLWYPVQYEGLEESPNILYTGSSLNQQITPALEWARRELGGTAFLVGSDYVFPRTANLLARALMERNGGASGVLGERHIPLGEQRFDDVVTEMMTARPDFVFNTLNGDSNQAFFRALARAGISAEELPVVSVSASEVEMQELGKDGAGHYACWNYFQSLPGPENRAFLERFSARHGADRAVSAPMVLAWYQLQLWKQAAEAAETFDPAAVAAAVVGQEIDGPGGPIEICPNHHARLPAYVGRSTPSGQFDIVWSSPERIDPLPWLGIGGMEIDARDMIIRALAAYPDTIHHGDLLAREVQERRRAEKALRRSQEDLERRVRERTAELEVANETLLDEMAQREEAEERALLQAHQILEMGTPVLRLWEGLAFAPVVGALDADRSRQLQEQLLQRIVEWKAGVVIIDLTGMAGFDSLSARYLLNTFGSIRLLGARVIVSGVHANIAQTMVDLGVSLEGIITCTTLETGLTRALELLRR